MGKADKKSMRRLNCMSFPLVGNLSFIATSRRMPDKPA